MMASDSSVCCVCLDPSDTLIQLCHDPISAKFTCRPCLLQYMDQKLSQAFPGACPPLSCPCHGKQLMDFTKLIELLPYEYIQRYSHLANSILFFLCGACHNSRSIAVEYNPSSVQEAESKVLENLLSVSKAQGVDFESCKSHFLTHLHEYCSGLVNVETFFEYCRRTFQELSNGTETEAMQILSNILRLIQNPERRNLLHLRFLNERPRFYTPCCTRLHCFRCKTKDFHDDKTCEENTSTLDSSIIACPSCNIHLAKADGCNSVSCVCGVQFSWSNELDVSD